MIQHGESMMVPLISPILTPAANHHTRLIQSTPLITYCCSIIYSDLTIITRNHMSVIGHCEHDVGTLLFHVVDGSDELTIRLAKNLIHLTLQKQHNTIHSQWPVLLTCSLYDDRWYYLPSSHAIIPCLPIMSTIDLLCVRSHWRCIEDIKGTIINLPCCIMVFS
jgi:hypothetical protein